MLLVSKRNINDFLAQKLSYLHIGLVQDAVKPLARKGINSPILMCLRDARFKKFNDSLLLLSTAFTTNFIYSTMYFKISK